MFQEHPPTSFMTMTISVTGEDYPRYVPASCKEYGMFLLEPNYTAMSSNSPNGIQHRTRDVVAEGSNCPALKETRVC